MVFEEYGHKMAGRKDFYMKPKGPEMQRKVFIKWTFVYYCCLWNNFKIGYLDFTSKCCNTQLVLYKGAGF